MQTVKKIFFTIIKSAITGKELTAEEKAAYKDEMFPHLFSLAKKHDILPMLILGLQDNGLGGKHTERFPEELAKGVYRYECLHYELEQISQVFEQEKIVFLPLKGAVIRKYYREPWIRTSCDIDILVKEAEIDRAVDILKSTCGYTVAGEGSHDVSLYSENGSHIELHYNLMEEYEENERSILLKDKIWEYTFTKQGYTYWREMTDEMFYFYHIAHMAKHFSIGGCGIRAYIDLWLLDTLENVDKQKRQTLLQQGGLSKFAEVASDLSKVWFEDKKLEKLTQMMQTFILQGGVYGSTENRVAFEQQKRGGKAKYLLSRIFLSYDILKFKYPILQKHRWLMPVMQVRRWGRLIFCGRLKHSLEEVKYNSNFSGKKASEMTEFFKEIGV